jgi:hypothetical protein
MAKTIRLTESELKNMIVESVKKIFESQMVGQDDNGGMWNSADWYEYEAAQELNEGRNDEPSNTHYAIHKPTGKIVFSWDYNGYDPEDLKLYKKDYFTVDLRDMGMNPKEITVITRKSCEKRGIDPTDDANWSNYPMSESLIKEIGDTDRGQELLGRAAGRAQKKAQNIGRSNDFDGYCKSMSKADKIGNYARDARIKTTGKADDANGAFTRGVKHSKQVLSEFNSVLPYGNSSSREPVKGSYELDAETLLYCLSRNNECGPVCDEVKEIIEMALDGCIIEFEGTLYREEDTNYSEVEDVTVDDSSVEFCFSEIDSLDEVSDEAKAYAKELLNNVVNDIDSNDIDWEW